MSPSLTFALITSLDSEKNTAMTRKCSLPEIALIWPPLEH
jgi:hypothetical protein